MTLQRPNEAADGLLSPGRPFAIRWRNFRGFEDSGWLDIRPLTVVIGPNNSGKTSLHVPLLLLKQSLASLDRELPLMTRGDLANAGSYRDLVFHHDESRRLALGLRFDERPSPRGRLKAIGSYPPGGCEFVFAAADDGSGTQLERFEAFDLYGRRLLRRIRQKGGSYTVRGLLGVRQTAGADEGAAHRRFLRALRRAQPDHFLFTPEPVLDVVAAPPTRAMQAQDRDLEVPKFAQAYASVTRSVADEVRDLLSRISYIGPLRDRPKRLYELSGETPADVGVQGRWAPEIMYRRSDKRFTREISSWLRRFDIGERADCVGVGEGTFFVCLTRGVDAPPINMADTGFGISQVLPLIVQGIYSPPNSVIIAEQPEIHLNPRLQAVLADLFCSLATSGKSALIETHSEHLLLRLRRLVAEGHIPPDDVALYFVERREDRSRVRRVPIGRAGEIDPKAWPVGFFEESLREALALAAAQSRSGHAR